MCPVHKTQVGYSGSSLWYEQTYTEVVCCSTPRSGLVKALKIS